MTNKDGKSNKVNLYLDYGDALSLADDDINENWELYPPTQKTTGSARG